MFLDRPLKCGERGHHKCLECGGVFTADGYAMHRKSILEGMIFMTKKAGVWNFKKEAAASVKLDGQTYDAPCPHDWRFELPEGNGAPYEVCAKCQATRLMPEQKKED